MRTTVTEGTTAETTNPRLALREGRPDHGAAAAFVGELYAQHGATVLGLCRLLLRDAVEAEDATQQVFVSAQRALLGGAVAREPAAWLVAIARNECRSRIRARMREPLALPGLPADIPDPLASAIHNADLDALWTALSELPRRQRNVFLLRELGGLSYGELGTALGVTRPAVESLLFRARQHLRNVLAAANAAFVPVALREQLVRLLPLGTPGGGASFGAKVAAVTVGVGLGAAGAVELPEHHSRHSTRTPSVAPVKNVVRHRASPPRVEISQPVVARHESSVAHGRSRHEQEAVHERHEGRGKAVPERGTALEGRDSSGSNGSGGASDSGDSGHSGDSGDGGGSD